MFEYWAILVSLFSLFVYSILFSIECGAAVLMYFPRRFHHKDIFHSYLSPIWETTNVFLVFALVSFMAFFPEAIPVWGKAFVVPFLFFLVAMGLRATGMLMVFYPDKQLKSGKILLLMGSVLSPALLVGGTLPFFLYGIESFSIYHLVFGVMAMGIMFLISYSFFTWMNHRGWAEFGQFCLTILIFGYFFFIFASMQLPYIVFPNITICNSFTDIASAKLLFIVLGWGALLIIPGLIWLFYSVLSKSKV